jgi:hypothetical protein
MWVFVMVLGFLLVLQWTFEHTNNGLPLEEQSTSIHNNDLARNTLISKDFI